MTRKIRVRRAWSADANGNYTFTRPVSGDEVVELALQVLRRRWRRGATILDPIRAREWLRLELVDDLDEVFCVLWLDQRHRVIGFERLFHGTIAGAAVHPRVLVRKALEKNAAACMLVHNHPSGVAEPSAADRAITKRIVAALELVEVRVIDHHVVTPTESVSFAERGWL